MDASFSSLADEFEDLTHEKTVTKAIRTDEEIQSVTVDENLTGIERALHLLNSTHDIQHMSAVKNLPSYFRENSHACVSNVLPKLKLVLQSAQTELHMVASNTFSLVAKEESTTPQTYAQSMLPIILHGIEEKDLDISRLWLNTLLDSIKFLPKEIVKKDIYQLAMTKSQFSQSVLARLTSCQLFRAIAPRLDANILKNKVMPLIQALCQDIDLEVRKCMCQQLAEISSYLGLDSMKSIILPELVELAKDEAILVRNAWFETISKMICLMDKDTCVNTTIPLVCRFCQVSYQAQDVTLVTISKEIGNICYSLRDYLNDKDKSYLLELYLELCTIGANSYQDTNHVMQLPVKDMHPMDKEELQQRFTECRVNAAYNLPSMVLFCGAEYFETKLFKTFSQMCSDQQSGVSKLIASGFHEIMKILGSNCISIFPLYLSFFQTGKTDICKMLLTHMQSVLKHLEEVSSHDISRDNLSVLRYVDLLNAVLSLSKAAFKTNDWRFQEQLMYNLRFFSFCVSGDTIYYTVLPELLNYALIARARPVQLTACYSLLVLIRNLPRLEWREENFTKIVSYFCRGNSFRLRSLFIDICMFTLQLYSKVFFKNHLFDSCLVLSEDPIPNIRLRFSRLMPTLKAVLVMPTDRNKFQHLETALRKLMLDETDNDVSKSLLKTIEELDKVQIQVETPASIRATVFEEDEEDRRKEAEEKALIDLEDKQSFEDTLIATASSKGRKMIRKDSRAVISSTATPLTKARSGSDFMLKATTSGASSQLSKQDPVKVLSKLVKRNSTSSSISSRPSQVSSAALSHDNNNGKKTSIKKGGTIKKK